MRINPFPMVGIGIRVEYYPIFLIFGHLGAKTRPKYELVMSWRQGVRILLKFGSRVGVCRRRKEAIAELSEEEWERKIGEREQKQERKKMATIRGNRA